MKRRYIIVPKNSSAENALDFDLVAQEDIIELILNEEEFNSLYQDNVFSLINELGNTNIEDYEDCKLSDPNDIKKVSDALNRKKELFKIENKKNIEQLIILFEEALNRNTSISFYF